jgi:hypothetical protein
MERVLLILVPEVVAGLLLLEKLQLAIKAAMVETELPLLFLARL